MEFYSSSLTSLESLFICLLIDALFVRVVSLGRMQGEETWGEVQKENLQNGSIWMGNACYAKFWVVCMLCQALGCMHAYTLPIQVAPKLSETSAQWMGSGYPRVHSFTKGERKTSHSMHFPYNPIDFASFIFRYCPQFFSPCTRPSETILTNRASIERQINNLFRDI